MHEIRRIAIADLERDEGQPRKHFDEGELLALGQNMTQHGQAIPIIAYEILAADTGAAKYLIGDGERRWRAAQLVGITELDAIVLAEKPTAAQLRVLQMSIDVHTVAKSAMERSNCLVKIQKETGWAVGELAANLHMKQPLVSKLLAYQKLCPEVRAMLDAGEICMEKAHVISQQPDAEKQKELAKAAGLSREGLRRVVRNGAGKVEPRVSKVSLALTGGGLVTLQRRDLTLSAAIDVLTGIVKELRKGLSLGLDITTQAAVLKDKAKKGA